MTKIHSIISRFLDNFRILTSRKAAPHDADGVNSTLVQDKTEPMCDDKTSSSRTAETKVTISKQQLADLPAAQFKGDIKVIDKADDISHAIAELYESDIIGFDTETRPSFRKGQSNMVSLLQLSTRKRCFLFRLNHIGLVQPLIDLLQDPSLLKIGLSIHDDFHNLNKISPIEPKGFVDLQNYVKQFRIADNSLSKIYAIIFGKRISKGQRLTNWEAETLTPSQQSYAALDALACIQIYDSITNGNFDPDKSAYLVEICQESADQT